jgi:NO-binding membrane sensor protein with MHYT domain
LHFPVGSAHDPPGEWGPSGWEGRDVVQVDQFTYGVVTPILSYGLSVLGSLLGLVGTARAREISDGGRRARWLILAACSIGGTGIWSMHFMAMLGFTLTGQAPIRFDLGITLASLLTAIVVVAIGLFIVGYGKPNLFKILAGGLFMGLGVAAMHYTGMAAMDIPAQVTYDTNLVIASVVIAVVASTVALFFTVTMKKPLAVTIAALIMGLAVNGMHFTGMFALRVIQPEPKLESGILGSLLLGPIVIFVIVVIIVLLASLLNRGGDGDVGDPTIRIFQPPPDPDGASPSGAPRQRTSAAAFQRRNR